jgi:glycosyltransferase involved in cell wall biosynthesis
MSVWYIYPVFKHVSWTSIADEHVNYLRQHIPVNALNEGVLPLLGLSTRPKILVQPYFYPFQRWENILKTKLSRINALIGIDVADSNRITEYAVRLTEYADAMVVPSEFARRAYVESGVRKPVHVLPHGVSEGWLRGEVPNTFSDKVFTDSLDKIRGKGYRLMLSYVMHSEYRKGYDLLREIYARVRRERADCRLVLKACDGVWLCDESADERTTLISHRWLEDYDKMRLFDVCDLYLLTSRGGGFEHPPLEGLARGLPMIGAKGGSWEDYMPPWAGVDSEPSGVVLEGNPIHCGIGVQLKVDKAVDKVLHMLDNIDDYKAKAREYANTVIREKFTWDVIGKELLDIIKRY